MPYTRLRRVNGSAASGIGEPPAEWKSKRQIFRRGEKREPVKSLGFYLVYQGSCGAGGISSVAAEPAVLPFAVPGHYSGTKEINNP